MKKSELQDILRQIAQLASKAAGDSDAGDSSEDSTDVQMEDTPVCTPKTLPSRLLEEAAKTAVEINPMNHPQIGPSLRSMIHSN